MKKLTRILFMVATTLCIAANANAAIVSNNPWFVNLKASTDTQARAGQANAKFGVTENGVKAKISAGYDPTVAEVTTNGPGPWHERWYVDMRSAADQPTQSKEWYFRVTGSSLSDTVYLTAWNPIAGDIVDRGSSPFAQVFLYSLKDGRRDRLLYRFDGRGNGAWSSANGVSGDYYQEAFHYTGEPLDFLLCQYIPEPSSILAVLTGVAGVAGLALRRKH